jgi:hypothetical protein
MTRRLLIALTLGLSVACDNANEQLALPELSQGTFAIGVILDRDGSQSLTPGDTVYSGARFALFAANGTDTLRRATTDTLGIAMFDSLPIGRYRYALIPSSLGDSLPDREGVEGTFRIIAARDSAVKTATARVGYASLSIAEVRGAPAGRRVFVRGIVSSALQFHSDRAMHITGGGNLRITNATHRPGRSGNNVGDSVVVFGTTGSVNGQPVLLDGLVQTLAERPAPVAIEVDVATARSAQDGALDAALVHIVGATVGDTVTVGEEFHVGIAQEADTITMVIDPLLQPNKSSFAPGRVLELRGVLVANGDGTWHIKPRPVGGEVRFD